MLNTINCANHSIYSIFTIFHSWIEGQFWHFFFWLLLPVKLSTTVGHWGCPSHHAIILPLVFNVQTGCIPQYPHPTPRLPWPVAYVMKTRAAVPWQMLSEGTGVPCQVLAWGLTDSCHAQEASHKLAIIFIVTFLEDFLHLPNFVIFKRFYLLPWLV